MTSQIQPVRVLVKALCLFVIINLLYALIAPQVLSLSAYNVIFPGRTRFPFAGVGRSFAVAVENVDTMFASHLISAPKRPDEYRVVLLGDSSVWGEDLGAHELISEQWNQLKIPCGKKTVRVYDLGYPHPSIVKDLVILEKATEYEPDLVIWFVTLNSLFSQRLNPFLTANRERVSSILTTYDISFRQSEQLTEKKSSLYDRTLMGQRSDLARQIKLQMMGIIWLTTGQDSNTLTPDEPVDFNVSDDVEYRGLQPSDEINDLLLWKAISAGYAIANPVPVMIVNEPIFIGTANSAPVRYNAIYPRWAYDRYRTLLAAQARSSGWKYLDLWDALPREYFSDAGLHRSAKGERLLIEKINPTLQMIGCSKEP